MWSSDLPLKSDSGIDLEAVRRIGMPMFCWILGTPFGYPTRQALAGCSWVSKFFLLPNQLAEQPGLATNEPTGRVFAISLNGIPRVDSQGKARLEATGRTPSKRRDYPQLIVERINPTC
jgi:hypothetical protein